MTSNESIHQRPHPEIVNLSDVYKVKYWSRRFDLSEKELKKIVEVVGNNVADIESYLKLNK